MSLLLPDGLSCCTELGSRALGGLTAQGLALQAQISLLLQRGVSPPRGLSGRQDSSPGSQWGQGRPSRPTFQHTHDQTP